MALTIDWLLNQNAVPGFTLLAGEKPFVQKIHGANIIDNPNTVPWLSPGTLVLSTGYLLSQNELSKDIIQQLQQKGCAGLAMKMNRYLDELPREMILQARELHFPIISIPFTCNLEQVISLIYRNLLDEEMLETRLSNKEIFFQKLLAKEPESPSETEALCTRNQFDYSASRICILFHLEGYAQLPFVRRRPEGHRILEFVKPLLCEYGIDHQYTFYQDHLVLFIFAGNPLNHKNYMVLGMQIAEHLSQILTNQGFPTHAGISADCSGVMTIRTSYQQARQALETGSQLRPGDRCFSYYQDRIYYELMNHFTFRELHAIYAEHLELLDQYDRENHTEYLSALQAYLSCNCSISQSARELYIHRNTLSYWLEQIRSVLGIDLKNADDRLALQIAFYARRILMNMKAETRSMGKP